MRELLLSNLAKTLPKYTHGKFYLNMLKKCKVDMSYLFKWLQSLILFEINFAVNQNYNKIIACDWLSPAQFEHHLDSAGVMLVTGQLNGTLDMSYLCKWAVRVMSRILATEPLSFHENI